MTSRTQKKAPPARRRPNRAEKREANRERILRAARTVFGRRGFHAATIEEIADEAGLSNGAIYYNFESKGDLLLALLEERQRERIAHLRRTFAKAPVATVGRDPAIDEETRDVTQSLKENREWRLLLLEFSAHAARTPSLALKLQAHKRELKATLTELYEQRFNEAGRTPPLPPDQLALVTAALANGLATEELSDPGSVPETLFGDLLATLLEPRPPDPAPRRQRRQGPHTTKTGTRAA
jgi:AcrR family transcriptional regulator